MINAVIRMCKLPTHTFAHLIGDLIGFQSATPP